MVRKKTGESIQAAIMFTPWNVRSSPETGSKVEMTHEYRLDSRNPSSKRGGKG